MKKSIILFLIAGTLSLLYFAGLVLACPFPLRCSNFTNSQKIQDCRYITSQKELNRSEKQEVLCSLWDQSYDYSGYQPNYDSVNVNLSLNAKQIDDSQFLLAGKIGVFFFMSYLLFSITKSSFILRWFVG